MKVLWITNVELPEAARHFGRNTFLGGWLDYSSRLLAKKDVELHICSKNTDEYDEVCLNDIYYSAFNEENCERVITDIIHKVNPDIIDIWGTEYYHSYIACRCAQKANLLNRTFVSIQGLITYIVDYYNADLDEKVVNRYTLSGIKNHSTIELDRKDMIRRSEYERKCLLLAKNCIGRTVWDHDGVKKINSDIRYYKCNDILRQSFYSDKWEYDKCDKHSIFFSQANYPLKGFHFMLEAGAQIKDKYPDFKIRVLGKGIENSFNSYIRDDSYRRYLRSLIKKYDLYDNIEWLGQLDDKQMVKEYLRCNVFVCASSIENSSNSVSEAMLLGVPVVASDVGGIRSLMEEDKEGMIYPYNDTSLLSSNIIKFFENKDMAINMAENAYIRAKEDHSPDKNTKQLIEIYKSVINS